MDAKKVDLFLITNASKFPPEKIHYLKKIMLEMDESKFDAIQFYTFKDPLLYLVISLFFGTLGIDRLMLGDIGLGVGKLLTLGGCGIWAIIDWFLIMDAAKEKNFNEMMRIVTL
jgi:TM2 domain-containing membrane protein YozV